MLQALQWQQNTKKTKLLSLLISVMEEHQQVISMKGLILQVSLNFLLFSSARTINGQYHYRGRNSQHQRHLHRRLTDMVSRESRWMAMMYLLFIKQQGMPLIKRKRVRARHSLNVSLTGFLTIPLLPMHSDPD